MTSPDAGPCERVTHPVLTHLRGMSVIVSKVHYVPGMARPGERVPSHRVIVPLGEVVETRGMLAQGSDMTVAERKGPRPRYGPRMLQVTTYVPCLRDRPVDPRHCYHARPLTVARSWRSTLGRFMAACSRPLVLVATGRSRVRQLAESWRRVPVRACTGARNWRRAAAPERLT